MRSHDQGGRFAIPDALILMYNLQPSSRFSLLVEWSGLTLLKDNGTFHWKLWPQESTENTGKRLAGCFLWADFGQYWITISLRYHIMECQPYHYGLDRWTGIESITNKNIAVVAGSSFPVDHLAKSCTFCDYQTICSMIGEGCLVAN